MAGFSSADLANGRGVGRELLGLLVRALRAGASAAGGAEGAHGRAPLRRQLQGPGAAARRFLGRYGNPFAAVGVDANGRAAIEWGVYGMPETFVVNGKGRIVYKHVGPITAETLETKIIPAIRAAEKG